MGNPHFFLELSEDFHYYVSMSDFWKVGTADLQYAYPAETQRCQFDEVSLVWAEYIEQMVFMMFHWCFHNVSITLAIFISSTFASLSVFIGSPPHNDMNTLGETNVLCQADRLRFIQCFRNVATHQVTTRDGNRPTTPVGCPLSIVFFKPWKSQQRRFSRWLVFCLFVLWCFRKPVSGCRDMLENPSHMKKNVTDLSGSQNEFRFQALWFLLGEFERYHFSGYQPNILYNLYNMN